MNIYTYAGAYIKTTSRLTSNKSYKILFWKRINKKLVGKRRTAIVTTINEDIERTKEKHTDFTVTPLISIVA